MYHMNIKNKLLLMLFILATFPTLTFAQGINVREERIKAACLYHITQYIDWPEEEKITTFNFCTFESKITYDYLIDTFKGKKKKNIDYNLINIDKTNSQQEIKKCNLLYTGENKLDSSIILNSNKLLVVSSNPDNFSDKTPIAIYKIGNKIAINIKLKVLKKIGFKVSSQLLNIAVIK